MTEPDDEDWVLVKIGVGYVVSLLVTLPITLRLIPDNFSEMLYDMTEYLSDDQMVRLVLYVSEWALVLFVSPLVVMGAVVLTVKAVKKSFFKP